MKIAYVANIRVPTPKAHGIQVMKMCEAFARQGAEVELVVPAKRNTLGGADPFDYYGVERLFPITKLRAFDFLSRTKAFGQLFYFIDAASFVLSLLLKRPFSPDTVIYLRDPLLLPFIRGGSGKFVEIHDMPTFPSLLQKADGIVAISSNLKDELVRMGVRAEGVIVAHDGVDLGKFDVAITKIEARSALGLDQNKRLAVYTGSKQPWKGTETLTEAARMLKDAEVLIIANKPYQDIPLYLKAADVLVIPNSGKEDISRLYTSPMKLFEYMASGRPIVASDLPSLREILDENSAYFFVPDDQHSLALTIDFALNDPKASAKAERAYEKVQAYTWNKRAAFIMEYMQS